VRARGLGAVTFASAVLLWATAPGYAQTSLPPAAAAPPQVTGFMPPYEIVHTVRSAGFNPLAPPLREGTNYVLRATDYRGILMRVVVDARTGAIRDANRIVPATYGQVGSQVGMGPPPYSASPDDMLPAYGPPPEFDTPDLPPNGPDALPPPPPRSAAARNATHPSVAIAPPLPRPRPAEFASRKPADDVKPETIPGDISGVKPSASPPTATGAKTDAKTDAKTEIRPDIKSGTKADAKSDVTKSDVTKSDVTTAVPTPPAKSGKATSPSTIND
jgi:hypothetical protein